MSPSLPFGLGLGVSSSASPSCCESVSREGDPKWGPGQSVVRDKLAPLPPLMAEIVA